MTFGPWRGVPGLLHTAHRGKPARGRFLFWKNGMMGCGHCPGGTKPSATGTLSHKNIADCKSRGMYTFATKKSKPTPRISRAHSPRAHGTGQKPDFPAFGRVFPGNATVVDPSQTLRPG